MLVLKNFTKSDKIYGKAKFTTANDTLYSGKVNEKLKSFVHTGAQRFQDYRPERAG